MSHLPAINLTISTLVIAVFYYRSLHYLSSMSVFNNSTGSLSHASLLTSSGPAASTRQPFYYLTGSNTSPCHNLAPSWPQYLAASLQFRYFSASLTHGDVTRNTLYGAPLRPPAAHSLQTLAKGVSQLPFISYSTRHEGAIQPTPLPILPPFPLLSFAPPVCQSIPRSF